MKTEKKRETVKTDKTGVAKAKSPENDAMSTLVEGFEPSTCLCPSRLLLSAFSPLATGDLLLSVLICLINSVTISDWGYGRDR